MLFTKTPKDFTPKVEVVSCFCEHDGDILLLRRQNNKPQGNTWGVPAGKIDIGEKPVEAVIREIKEETNTSVDEAVVSFFDKVYLVHEDLELIYHIFQTKFNKRPEVQIKEKEHKKYVWVSPKNALGMNLIEDLDECIKLYYKVK